MIELEEVMMETSDEFLESLVVGEKGFTGCNLQNYSVWTVYFAPKSLLLLVISLPIFELLATLRSGFLLSNLVQYLLQT